MTADLGAEHAALTVRMTEAGSALGAVETQMQTRNTEVQRQYDTMHALQDSNNALQQKALEDLARETLLENALSAARVAALHGHVDGLTQRLQTVKEEIEGVQARDGAAMREKVSGDFATTQAHLEADLGVEHAALWTQLNHSFGQPGVGGGFAALRAEVQAREGWMLKFSSETEAKQRSGKQQDAIKIDAMTRMQAKDRKETDAKLRVLLEALDTVKERLETQLARIAFEERADDASMRSKIDTDMNTTVDALRAKTKTLHVRMAGELEASLRTLMVSLQAVKTKEERHTAALVARLSHWDAEQHATNKHQRTWLQKLTMLCEHTALGVGVEIKALGNELGAADKHLTKQGDALEAQQRAVAQTISKELGEHIVALRKEELAYAARTAMGVHAAIGADLESMSQHLGALNQTAADIRKSMQAAIAALANSIDARAAQRTKEVTAIIKAASDDKAGLQHKIEQVLAQISSDKTAVHAAMSKSKVQREEYRTGLYLVNARFVLRGMHQRMHSTTCTRSHTHI